MDQGGSCHPLAQRGNGNEPAFAPGPVSIAPGGSPLGELGTRALLLCPLLKSSGMGCCAAPPWAHAVGSCGEGRNGREPLTLQKPGWLSPECSDAKVTPCPALLTLLFPLLPSCRFPGLFWAACSLSSRVICPVRFHWGPSETIQAWAEHQV